VPSGSNPSKGTRARIEPRWPAGCWTDNGTVGSGDALLRSETVLSQFRQDC
jgi:hypothetical protein